MDDDLLTRSVGQCHDAAFDPQPDHRVTVGDVEKPSIRGWIARRDTNKVWVPLEFGLVATDIESRALDHG